MNDEDRIGKIQLLRSTNLTRDNSKAEQIIRNK